MSNSDPAKIALLRIHMAGGMAILALMLIRLIVRWRTARPPKATIGSRSLESIAPFIHWGFYILVAGMVASGYTTGILAGLNRSVFAESGEPPRADFAAYPSFRIHGLLAAILVAFLALHAAATLYHQFVRRGRVAAPHVVWAA